MATIIYVEFKAKDGTLYDRQPCGNMKEAQQTMIEMLEGAEPSSLSDGDNIRIIVESDQQ